MNISIVMSFFEDNTIKRTMQEWVYANKVC